MPKKQPQNELATREQQIMDAIHSLGEATVSSVRAQLTDPPSYSSVRTMIRHLESKGHLRHRQEGKRYVYKATQSRASASRTALRKLLDVFFAGSPSDAVAAILDVQRKQIDQAELDRIDVLIQNARTEGR